MIGHFFISCVLANVKWNGKIDSDRPTKTGTTRSKQCKKRWRWVEQGWHLINGRAAAENTGWLMANALWRLRYGVLKQWQ